MGEFQANCYVIAEKKGGEGIVVDPGGSAGAVLDEIKRNKLHITYIIATHAHIDHIKELPVVKESTGADFLLHSLDTPLLQDPHLNLSSFMDTPQKFPSPEGLLQDKQKLRIGGLEVEIIHTPGHTPGGICLKIDGDIFTGDTLFAGGVGRVDLPRGDFGVLQRSIKERIFCLSGKAKVFPGHGSQTTVNREKRENPFV